MLVYYFVPFIVSNRYLLFWVSNGHNSVTVQNRTHVYMNFFDHKDLGNHLLQLCHKVAKHPVYKHLRNRIICTRVGPQISAEESESKIERWLRGRNSCDKMTHITRTLLYQQGIEKLVSECAKCFTVARNMWDISGKGAKVNLNCA